MPFGKSMISSVKSNKSEMLDESKRFIKTVGGYVKREKGEANVSKATAEQLLEIKRRHRRENSALWIRIIGLSILLIITLVGIIFTS
jgi:hypothetical protein